MLKPRNWPRCSVIATTHVIQVKLAVDADGLLTVAISEESTNGSQKIELKNDAACLSALQFGVFVAEG